VISVSPTLASVSLPAATVGTPYTATITVDGTPTITYAVTGTLPDGLVLAPATGVISGTPTTAGSSTFSITATNSVGTDSAAETIVVAAAAVTPPGPTPGATVPAVAAAVVAVPTAVDAGTAVKPSHQEATELGLLGGLAIIGATGGLVTVTRRRPRQES
jgi:hypothetical protein